MVCQYHDEGGRQTLLTGSASMAAMMIRTPLDRMRCNCGSGDVFGSNCMACTTTTLLLFASFSRASISRDDAGSDAASMQICFHLKCATIWMMARPCRLSGGNRRLNSGYAFRSDSDDELAVPDRIGNDITGESASERRRHQRTRAWMDTVGQRGEGHDLERVPGMKDQGHCRRRQQRSGVGCRCAQKPACACVDI